MDWSDSEVKGFRAIVGDEISEIVVQRCNVHLSRSYQRVTDRVNDSAKEKLAVDAFCNCKIAKCIEVTSKQFFLIHCI